MKTIEDILQKYPTSLFTRDSDSEIGRKWQADLELLNEVRSVLESIKGTTDYKIQSGAILDLIGKNLKQPRNGLDDFRFRIFFRSPDKSKNRKATSFQ